MKKLLLLMSLFTGAANAAPACNQQYGSAGSTSNCVINNGNTAYLPDTSGHIPVSGVIPVAGTLSPTVPPATYDSVTKMLHIPNVCVIGSELHQHCFEVQIYMPNPDIRYGAYVGLNLS